MAPFSRTAALLLLLACVQGTAGSLGVLGRVENDEGELRHTVGVVGRADEKYQKAEGVRAQAKEVESSALHMERVLEKRLAGLMAKESRSTWIQPKKGSSPAMPSTAVAHTQQKAQVHAAEKPASAAAARKAAVLAAKHATEAQKHEKPVGAHQSWIKQWLWPFV